MLLSEKVTLAMTLWVIFALIVTGPASFDVFIILVLIGILIIRELSDMFTPFSIKDRFDIFIFIGLVIFIAIVVSKVLTILRVI